MKPKELYVEFEFVSSKTEKGKHSVKFEAKIIQNGRIVWSFQGPARMVRIKTERELALIGSINRARCWPNLPTIPWTALETGGMGVFTAVVKE